MTFQAALSNVKVMLKLLSPLQTVVFNSFFLWFDLFVIIEILQFYSLFVLLLLFLFILLFLFSSCCCFFLQIYYKKQKQNKNKKHNKTKTKQKKTETKTKQNNYVIRENQFQKQTLEAYMVLSKMLSMADPVSKTFKPMQGVM